MTAWRLMVAVLARDLASMLQRCAGFKP